MATQTAPSIQLTVSRREASLIAAALEHFAQTTASAPDRELLEQLIKRELAS